MPGKHDRACRLSGTNLFLLDSVSGDPQFSQPTPGPRWLHRPVAAGEARAGQLYGKLRER
jgi:hypothetical protein